MRSALFIFFLICVHYAEGQNRIATQADRQVYGDYITPGDLIIDTPTPGKDKRNVIYYFMAKEWPRLREKGVIWLDGDKLGPLNEIKFCNTSRSMNPWHIESVSVRNIPHTRVVAKSFVCSGLKDFELDGQSSSFPGLSAWPESRKFLTGSFGFHVIGNLTSGHAYSINVRDGGTIRLNGFESQHAFSGVRINGGKEDIIVESLEISNFYIHDTATGEGFYLGATFKPPLARLKNLRVHHGILARTAAEAVQFQHMAGGADVHHLTILAADTRWLNEFASGQDTGIQWVVDAGENKLHHIILDGYGSVAFMPFGADAPGGTGVSKVSNVLFNNGRDTGIYLHKSASFGVHWTFDSLYFRDMSDNYYKQTGRNVRDFYISRRYGTDKVTFNRIYHDGSKRKVFEDTTGIKLKTQNLVEKKLPAPTYVNSGFHEPANRIKQWHRLYAHYFPIARRDTARLDIPTQWQMGDIAIETEGEYAFYKCVKTHLAETRRPAECEFFVKLTWDANGVRSDQPKWDSSSFQSTLPPDDLRLAKTCYWKKLGLGFQERLLEAPPQ